MKENGSALIEAAIVIPLLLFLLIGFVDIGLLINTKIVANEAARAAAREYVISEDETVARSKAGYLTELEGFKIVHDNNLITTEVTINYKPMLQGVWELFNGENDARQITGISTFRLNLK